MTRAIYAAFDVFPRAKGSSSHIASMVRALRGVCDQVNVLCLGAPGLPAHQHADGITIHRLPPRYPGLLARATAFAQFVQHHAAAGAELLVFRDPWGGAPLLRALPGVPAIFEVNALPSWELAYSRPSYAANPALQAKVGDLERFCLKQVREILCVSSVTAQALGRSNITVIPNGAADHFFSPDPDDAPAPCPIPELNSGRWFGYVGGFQPWQGVEPFLEAYRHLAPDVPDIRLVLLSEGRPPRKLPERVLFAGPVAHGVLPAVLRRLEFTVAPLLETARNTVQGCCPVKMVESMAAGVPVMASNLAVCREWLQDGSEGLLVEPGDRRAWIKALYSTITSPQPWGPAARLRAQRDFSYPHVHRQLQTVFRRVLWN